MFITSAAASRRHSLTFALLGVVAVVALTAAPTGADTLTATAPDPAPSATDAPAGDRLPNDWGTGSITPDVRAVAYDPANRDADHMGDLYLPRAGGNRGVLIVVHGGGFTSGERADLHRYLGPLLGQLDRGLAILTISYRFDPFPAAVLDLDAASSLRARTGWRGAGSEPCDGAGGRALRRRHHHREPGAGRRPRRCGPLRTAVEGRRMDDRRCAAGPGCHPAVRARRTRRVACRRRARCVAGREPLRRRSARPDDPRRQGPGRAPRPRPTHAVQRGADRCRPARPGPGRRRAVRPAGGTPRCAVPRSAGSTASSTEWWAPLSDPQARQVRPVAPGTCPSCPAPSGAAGSRGRSGCTDRRTRRPRRS